jgi:hypothetical protein
MRALPGTPLREMYREAVVAVMDAALAFLTALAEGLRTNRCCNIL